MACWLPRVALKAHVHFVDYTSICKVPVSGYLRSTEIAYEQADRNTALHLRPAGFRKNDAGAPDCSAGAGRVDLRGCLAVEAERRDRQLRRLLEMVAAMADSHGPAHN